MIPRLAALAMVIAFTIAIVLIERDDDGAKKSAVQKTTVVSEFDGDDVESVEPALNKACARDQEVAGVAAGTRVSGYGSETAYWVVTCRNGKVRVVDVKR